MTNQQQYISNLEEKYMNILWDLFNSNEFKKELVRLQNCVNNEYDFIKANYDKKNKIDIAIERLIRFFVYKKSAINIVDIYPSPISCDMAVETDDCILNIDSKTIDSIGNRTDINYFHFESNQSSFQHTPYGAQVGIHGIGEEQRYEGFPIKTSLKPIDPYTGKPILTFFLKVIYADTGFEFSYYKSGSNLSLTCLPNGMLSNLFPENIIFNFKTYIYADERLLISEKTKADEKDINFEKDYTHNLLKFPHELRMLGFNIPFVSYNFGLINKRPVIINNNKVYAPVKRKYNGGYAWYLEEMLSGHTARILYSTLKNRLNGNNLIWLGHRETNI